MLAPVSEFLLHQFRLVPVRLAPVRLVHPARLGCQRQDFQFPELLALLEPAWRQAR